MRAIAKTSFAVVATAALLLAVPALAETEWCFVAGLDGASVVPPSDSPGVGHASFFLNEEQDALDFYVEYSDVDVVTSVGIYDASDNLLFSLPTSSPAFGSWAIPAGDLAALFGEQLYIQVNTEEYPAGAIRGDIVFCAVENQSTTMGTVKTLFQ